MDISENGNAPRLPQKKRRQLKGLAVATAFTMAVTGIAAIQTAYAHTEGQSVEKIEVTFVLDTTGSMGPLIDGAKKKIWSIANTIVDINPNADIRMGLVGYRDYGDEYVIKNIQLTSDLQDMYSHLMKFRAAGGGDRPEAVNEALDSALNEIKWSDQQNAKRIVFLVGDAPPHMDYNGPKYPELVHQANKRDIVINAVQAGARYDTRRVWQRIAALGQGDYIPIPQNGGQVVIIETPFDDDIIILQRKIDETVLPYGNDRIRSKITRKLREKAEMEASAAVESSRYHSRKAKGDTVVSGAGDLVAEYSRSSRSVLALDDAKLPEQLKGKNAIERKAYLDKRLDVRRQLQKQLAELVSKRDGYLEKEKARSAVAAAPSFDSEVKRSLTKILK